VTTTQAPYPIETPTHGEVAPPPADTPLAQRVAEILLAAYAIDKAADIIVALLAPWRIGRNAVLAALGLANHAVKARPKLAVHGIGRTVEEAPAREVARTVAADDAYYRAAYLVRAATRIQRAIDDGASPREAVRDEKRHYDAHRAARENRLDVAARVGAAAVLFGPLLGWYRDPTADSEAECIAADGANFRAAQAPLIGYPGSVHPRCRCKAGPPHATRVMVDDAVQAAIGGRARPVARVTPRAS